MRRNHQQKHRMNDFGDSYERAEVVNYLLVDGRLDKLKEKINGRDAA